MGPSGCTEVGFVGIVVPEGAAPRTYREWRNRTDDR